MAVKGTRGELRRSLALAMLNRRISILGKQENAPFTSAWASVSEQLDFLTDSRVQLVSKSEQWTNALAAGEQELRRAEARTGCTEK